MNNIDDSSKITLSSRLSNKVYQLKRNSNDPAATLLNNESKNKHLKIYENISNYTLNEQFFTKACIDLAKSLLGKTLVKRLPTGEILKGRIVETECYLGIEDKASHSYLGKKTERNTAMFEKPGTAYVYTIYGMYYCFNISSLEEGSAVLLRALEPIEGITTMHEFRSEKRKVGSILKDKDLCNGPSKLCQAFKINKLEHNKINMCKSEFLWLEDGLNIDEADIITCKRIGIDSAGEEWANKPLRFYIKNCIYVSIRNKQAEKEHSETDTIEKKM